MARARNGETPLWRQIADIVLIDLRERRVPVPAGIAVVSRPIRLRGYLPIFFSRPAQQVHVLIGGLQLQIVEPLAEYGSLQLCAIRQFHCHPHNGAHEAPLDGAKELHQIGHFRFGSGIRRHFASYAVVYQFNELGIVFCPQPSQNGRAHFAAISIAAMTLRTARFEGLTTSGIRILRHRREMVAAANSAMEKRIIAEVRTTPLYKLGLKERDVLKQLTRPGRRFLPVALISAGLIVALAQPSKYAAGL